MTRRALLLATISLTMLCLPTSADEEKTLQAEDEFNLAKDGLALQGYDPVAYFKEGGATPTPGKGSITHTLGKRTYRFATEANRDRFKASPEKYEPAYGGWCAYAMGDSGEKVEINPKAFIITDGQLFLFYKTFLTDTRKPWTENEATLKPKADTAWERISAAPGKKNP